MDVSDLIDRYCAVWSEPDRTRRSAALEELWGDGASYSDPSVETFGSAELLSHISAAHGRWPGLALRRTSVVDHHHRVARFTWEARQADGPILIQGLDVVVLAEGGDKLERVVGFFGSLDSAEARV